MFSMIISQASFQSHVQVCCELNVFTSWGAIFKGSFSAKKVDSEQYCELLKAWQDLSVRAFLILKLVRFP